MSPLWSLVVRWWCGGRAAAVLEAVDSVVTVRADQPSSVCSTSHVAARILERPSSEGQAAQLAAAAVERAARRAEV